MFSQLFLLIVALVAITSTLVMQPVFGVITYDSNFVVSKAVSTPASDVLTGITFTSNGDMFTFRETRVCRYDGAANLPTIPINQVISTPPVCATVAAVGLGIVASKKNKLFTSDGVQIDTATLVGTQRWTSTCGPTNRHGITLDPRNGDIYISNYDSQKIYRVPNPDDVVGPITIDCTTPYFDAGAASLGGVDGMVIGPDGTLYMSAYDSNNMIIVSGWSISSPTGIFIASPPAGNTHPDGISICSDGTTVPFAMVAVTAGQIRKIPLDGTYTPLVIGDTLGGYLDFATVDPKGCTWGTIIYGGTFGTDASTGIYRVTNADGTCSCVSNNAPPPVSGGYSYKCGQDCFLCGTGMKSQVTYNKGGVTIIGGCEMGKCATWTELAHPRCLETNIQAICPNRKAISNVEFYAIGSDSKFICKNKIDSPAPIPAPFNTWWN